MILTNRSILKWNHLYDVQNRKSKLHCMRYEMREDLKIFRFSKKLKVYVTRNGKRRHNLDAQVMKESKDEVKDVQIPCLW